MKQNLLNIANWSKLAPILRQLHKEEHCEHNSTKLRLFTLKEKALYSWNGPILVIYGGQKLLDAVDTLTGSASVLYIPWGSEDYSGWVSTWGAQNLLGGTSTPIPSDPANDVLFYALKGLTDYVNLRTGIINSSDKEQAVRTLETLYHNNAKVEPEQIRQRLVRLGWNPKHAADVKKLAEMIWEGRRPKGSSGKGNEDLWSYWERKVAGN